MQLKPKPAKIKLNQDSSKECMSSVKNITGKGIYCTQQNLFIFQEEL